MKGHPLLRLLVILALFAFALLPLWRLTRVQAGAVQIQPKEQATGTNVRLQLTFAHGPKTFRVEHLGRTLWEGAGGGLTQEKTVTLRLPKEGVDLVLKVEWPEKTPESAVRLAWTVGDAEKKAVTLWGKEKLGEVVTLP
jgi:hypothetical protein